MIPPLGIIKDQQLVCKLQKTLYGSKEASECCSKKFREFLENFGLKVREAKKCAYIAKFYGNLDLLVLYVDDGLILSKSTGALTKITNKMKDTYEVTKLFCQLEIEVAKEN